MRYWLIGSAVLVVGVWYLASFDSSNVKSSDEQVASLAVVVYLVNHFRLEAASSPDRVSLYVNVGGARYSYLNEPNRIHKESDPLAERSAPTIVWTAKQQQAAMELMSAVSVSRLGLATPSTQSNFLAARAAKKALESYERAEPFLTLFEEPKHLPTVFALHAVLSLAREHENRIEFDERTLERALHDPRNWSGAQAVVDSCFLVPLLIQSADARGPRGRGSATDQERLQGAFDKCKELMPSRGDTTYLSSLAGLTQRLD
jgi:hypothetical protein